MADSLSVTLECSIELVALHDLSDCFSTRADDEIGIYTYFTNPLLELLAQAIVEDGVSRHEPSSSPYILTEKDDGHGDGDLGCGDKILDRYVGLINNGDEVSKWNTDFGMLKSVIGTAKAEINEKT